MHPSSRLRGTTSGHLEGKRIVLGVAGSIAAVEAVAIAHELQRHGAEVIPVMTTAATKIITPLALEYATGRPPVVHLSGRGEHVEWMDGPGRADLFLVAPATANTLAKIALGVDDTALTSFATVALGSKIPIVVAPAMHEVMNRNPAVKDRLDELQRMGVYVVPPRIEEGKAKVATPPDIAAAVIHRLADGPWVGKRVLVISGSTAEAVDPIRVITNRSTGRMGVELARSAYRKGAHVTLWNAWGAIPLPTFARVERFQSVADLVALCRKGALDHFDCILMPAALSDFKPKAVTHKIGSDERPPPLELEPLPKVIKIVRDKAPDAVLVAFKAETDPKRLVDRARQRLGEYGADLVVANTHQAFGADETEVQLVAAKGRPRRLRGRKVDLASQILDAAARHLRA